MTWLQSSLGKQLSSKTGFSRSRELYYHFVPKGYLHTKYRQQTENFNELAKRAVKPGSTRATQPSMVIVFVAPKQMVTGRFAHFPVRPESFRPESFRPGVVSPSITWVVSPSYPESFRPLLDESFRPLSEFIFYWRYCEKFTVFVSFNEDFVKFL